MAYQCKQPCLPPPADVAQCPGDTQDSCTFTDMAQCIQTCDCPSLETCSAPDRPSYQAEQPCTAPSTGVPLCPMVISIPISCAPPCLSLHTEMCAAPPSVPCGPVMLQPPCPEDPQPCSSGTADVCAPPYLPPTCGSSCPDNCSGYPQGGEGNETPYACPGSIVCLDPSGSVSVKPSVGSPELDSTTMFLASYQPHYM